MIQKIAWVFGVAFIAAGVAGFIPALTPDGKLLGLLQVNTVENIIHLLGGALGVFAAMSSEMIARRYFQIFGVVYMLVAIVGFVQGDTVLGLFPTDMILNTFHLVVSAAMLYVGFIMKSAMGSMSNSGGVSSTSAM